uniref:Uncharacterized protein n=1 Tax=Trypanosoma congolense (strain IL3000) TaxID=1068625 RepID=G0UU75_TRYCI|nr:conserved hypothetical protein [Trypanosoma congolense IL3000]
MKSNPYLMRYFGDTLEDVSDNCEYDAAANFAYFPNAKHMTQRIFKPSETKKPSEAAMHDEGTSRPHSDGVSFLEAQEDEEKVTAMGWAPAPIPPNELAPCGHYVVDKPPLLPSSSRPPTEAVPKDVHEVSVTPVPAASTSPEQVETVDWDLMIERSRLAIEQAKELLRQECGKLFDDTDSHSPAAQRACTSPDSAQSIDSMVVSPQTVESDCNFASYAQNFSSDANELMSNNRRLDFDEPLEMTVRPHEVGSTLKLTTLESLPIEEQPQEVNSNAAVSQPTINPLALGASGVNGEEPMASPAITLPVETKCVLLGPNPDVAACIAKRLTRRPPPALTVHKYCNPETLPRAAVAEVTNRSAEEGPGCSELISSPNDRMIGTHRLNEHINRYSVTTVAPGRDTIRQCSHNLRNPHAHPARHSSREVARGVWKEAQPGTNEMEGSHRGRNGPPQGSRGRVLQIPAPQVLVGNSPQCSTNMLVAGDQRGGSFVRTLPTSELPVVNADFHSSVVRRSGSVTRSSVSGAMAPPRYARPTESWLCKGLQLCDDYSGPHGVKDVFQGNDERF